MRELWRQAARALSRASQVALVGYSLPATDLVTAGMLADNLAGRPVRIDVVNPAPEPVAQQMERLNLAGDVHCYTGLSAIAEFVDELELSAARNVTQALQQRDTNAPVAVGDYSEGSAVLALERRADGSIDLVLEERYGSQQVNRSRQEQEPDPIRLGDLLVRTHESGSASPLCVQWPDGRSSRIVEAGRWRFDTGHEPEWVVLVPSASPHT